MRILSFLTIAMLFFGGPVTADPMADLQRTNELNSYLREGDLEQAYLTAIQFDDVSLRNGWLSNIASVAVRTNEFSTGREVISSISDQELSDSWYANVVLAALNSGDLDVASEVVLDIVDEELRDAALANIALRAASSKQCEMASGAVAGMADSALSASYESLMNLYC